MPMAVGLSEFERGVLVGILIGEGHFGGDGRQPQVTLRMHTRHERLFRWLEERFPRARLYGPYSHGGRSYFQWMARGRSLAEDLLPLLDPDAIAAIDQPAGERLGRMLNDYREFFARYDA
jgi:hypothetical protein